MQTIGTEPNEGTLAYKVEVVGDGDAQNFDNNRYAGATCFKSGQVDHIRPTCPSTGPDKKLDPQNDNQGGDNGQNGQRPDTSPGTTVPSRMVSPAIVKPTTGQTANRPPPIVEQTEVVTSIDMQSEKVASVEARTGIKGLDTAPINAIVPEPCAWIDSIELSQTGSSSVCPTEPALRSQIGTTTVGQTGSTRESSIRSNEAPSEDNSNRTEPRGWLAWVHVNGILMMLAVDMGAAMTIINSRKFL
jgi:hypothetical protein